jgi:ppGpp synthetase/RelA/SpoT-type nucleotidyltranferase
MNDEVNRLVEEIEDFKVQYGKQYERLLLDVRGVLKNVEDYRTHDLIRTIYDRSEKQDGEIFKSPIKIAKKLTDWRRTKPDTKIEDIHDLIGITVVLYYADDAKKIIDLTVDLLSEKNIIPLRSSGENPSYHKDFGYHAIHLIAVSKSEAHYDLKIEIQFKTMLHDAWGSKTHDLTYKPRGQLDPKIKRIMESLGDSLQAIEVQSETLRNLIQQEKTIDTEHRRTINTLIASGLRKRFPESPGIAKALFEEIESNSEYLSKCSIGDARIQRIREDIEKNSEIVEGIGPARYLLNVWIACIRISDDLNHIAQLSINNVRATMRQKSEMKSFLWAAMMSYFIRDTERAILLCKQGLRSTGGDTVTEYQLKNNLCYFLIESCGDNPPDIEARKDEAGKLKAELESDKLPTELKAAAKFTAGTYFVAFGETEKEIRAGISACETAYDDSPTAPEPFVRLLLDVCRRQGWRRILYLETVRRTTL